MVPRQSDNASGSRREPVPSGTHSSWVWLPVPGRTARSASWPPLCVGPLQRGCADGAMPLTWQATPDQSPRSGRTTAPRSEPAFPAGLAAPAGPPSAVVVDRIQQAVTRPVLENHSAAPESFAAEAAGPRRKFLDPRQVAARCHTVDVGNAAIPQVALHTMAGIAVLALPVSAKTAKPIPFRVVNIPVAI